MALQSGLPGAVLADRSKLTPSADFCLRRDFASWTLLEALSCARKLAIPSNNTSYVLTAVEPMLKPANRRQYLHESRQVGDAATDSSKICI
jgi:hypothetical protein